MVHGRLPARRVVPTPVVLLVLLAAQHAHAQATAIRAGHVIEPATGSVADHQTILVKDGKVTAIGPNVAVPAGAQVIDLSASWVLPGLMDAHAHITFGQQPPLRIASSYLEESAPMRALRGLHYAQALVEAGFTTVRDAGNEANYASIDLRRAIERGWFHGPTIVTMGKIIGPFGGQFAGTAPDMGPYWKFEYIDADTPDEMRKAVRQNIFYGAQAIKLVCDNAAYHCTLDEVRAAVAEAHAAGLPVSVHVLGGPTPNQVDAARIVIEGGADSIEHGFMLPDELLQMMKDRGMVLVSTDFPFAHLQAMMPADVARVMGAALVDRLRRALKAGVKIAFGTDVVIDLPGRTRPDMMFDYLDLWASTGVTPAAALKAMTTTAAELLRVQAERGSIAVGKAADIVATPDNPLERISALRKIHFVMKDGAVVRRPAATPPGPSAPARR
ncbi:MAG: amidohydrolase family protein [Bacteroidales bacterium]